MKKAILLLLLLVSATLSFGQDINSKLSPSTLMFLQQRDSKVSSMPAKTSRLKRPQRLAPVERRGNRNYISCFLRLADSNDLGAVTAKGVRVMCKFRDGLCTALIPTDSIESLARLSSVRRINVATRMTCATDTARHKTKVDSVINESYALAAGLKKKYDGRGVLLAIVDNGIDFQHIAFKDSKGQSRIKRAYVYTGEKPNLIDGTVTPGTVTVYYNGDKINGLEEDKDAVPFSDTLTTDFDQSYHGTHTASIAGGSSVIFDGDTTIVTDDHTKANAGGMAPGADLYLCGIQNINTVYVVNAYKYICDYADATGQPLVVSNSFGTQEGPHDGTGDFADVINQYFGDAHPNRICLFSASNDAGRVKDNEHGGYSLRGTASKDKPVGAILRDHSSSSDDGGCSYSSTISNCITHNAYSGLMGVKVYILDASTGAILETETAEQSNASETQTTINLNSKYYYGDLFTGEGPQVKVFWNTTPTGRKQILLSTKGMATTANNYGSKNGDRYYTSKYTLAVQFYPLEGEQLLDCWGGYTCHYSDHLTTPGITWTEPSDNSSVCDEACNPNVIAVGAYVTKNTVTDYQGTAWTNSEYTLGDIAYWSSYQAEGYGATGEQLPHITAPGAEIVAAINHYEGSFGSTAFAKRGRVLVNSDPKNMYGSLSGTSMACPAAAGIVALWLQAATEAGKNLTTTEVKNIMKETAIHDEWTKE